MSSWVIEHIPWRWSVRYSVFVLVRCPLLYNVAKNHFIRANKATLKNTWKYNHNKTTPNKYAKIMGKAAFTFLMQCGVWFFIRPFEKRDVLCRGNVRPSVCPSVCPSVRPSVRVFRTFLQHALRYQFETWYIHSVGGTTCRVWVASQLGHFDLVYSQK